MWQRDPGGGGTGGGPVGQGGKTVLQKEREKKEKARMKATLRRRVAIVLEQLQHEEGTVWATLLHWSPFNKMLCLNVRQAFTFSNTFKFVGLLPYYFKGSLAVSFANPQCCAKK